MERYEELANEGMEFINSNQYRKARGALEASLAINPDYAVAVNRLGIVENSDGNKSKAIELYKRAADLDPQFVKPLSNLILALGTNGNLAEASRYLEVSERLEDSEGLCNCSMGIVFFENEEYENSELFLIRTIIVNPNNVLARWYLGHVYYKQSDFEKSIKHLRKAVLVDSNHSGVRDMLACSLLSWCHQIEPNKWPDLLDEAEENLVKAKELGADLTYNFACIYAMQGKPQKALDELRNCECVPSQVDEIEHDSDLQSLKNHPEFRTFIHDLRASAK
jgi:tetratricopeptide (TPR) repeat protein